MRDDIESAVRLINERNERVAQRAEAGAWAAMAAVVAAVILASALVSRCS